MKTREILITAFSILMPVVSLITILTDDDSTGADEFLSVSPKITTINGVYFDYTSKEDVRSPNSLNFEYTTGNFYIKVLWIQSKKLKIDNQPYYAFLFGVKGPVNKLEIKANLYDYKPKLSYILINRFEYEGLKNRINEETEKSIDIKGDFLGWDPLDTLTNEMEDEKLLKNIRSCLNGGLFSFKSIKNGDENDKPALIIANGHYENKKTVRFLLPDYYFLGVSRYIGTDHFEVTKEEFKKLLLD